MLRTDLFGSNYMDYFFVVLGQLTTNHHITTNLSWVIRAKCSRLHHSRRKPYWHCSRTSSVGKRYWTCREWKGRKKYIQFYWWSGKERKKCTSYLILVMNWFLNHSNFKGTLNAGLKICQYLRLHMKIGSWTIAPKENCPPLPSSPTLKLTLTLTQTLTLTRGHLFGNHENHMFKISH